MTTGAWLPPAEAASALGIKGSALRERFSRGTVKRNEAGHYWVEAPAFSLSIESPPLDVKHDDGVGAAYYFDEARDKYLFSLRSKAQAGKPFVLAGDTVRAILLAYSRDGSDATINEICRTFGLNRTTLRETLRALGKTHDSAPFTDEAIASGSEDDLAEDLVRLKEERIIRRAEKASWEQTKKLAEEARLRSLRRTNASRRSSRQGVLPPGEGPRDPHVDKTSAGCRQSSGSPMRMSARRRGQGNGGRREQHRERACADDGDHARLIGRVLRFCRPARFCCRVASTTSMQTPTSAPPRRRDAARHRRLACAHVLAACSIYEELIGILLAVAPVEVVAVPGNHDDGDVDDAHALALRALHRSERRDGRLVRRTAARTTSTGRR
jgi:hypothetical protein